MAKFYGNDNNTDDSDCTVKMSPTYDFFEITERPSPHLNLSTNVERQSRKTSDKINYFVSFGVIKTPYDTQNGYLSTCCQKNMQPTTSI